MYRLHDRLVDTQLNLTFFVADVCTGYEPRHLAVSIHTVMSPVHDTGGTTEVGTVDRPDYGLND